MNYINSDYCDKVKNIAKSITANEMLLGKEYIAVMLKDGLLDKAQMATKFEEIQQSKLFDYFLHLLK